MNEDHMVPREARMQFKTAAEIRAAREAAGKDAEREEKAKAKLAERANRKYARMAEEAAKREAAAKASKPKLVVNRDNVIVAPVLLAEKAAKRPGKEAAKAKVKADAAAIRAGEVSPSKGGEPHTIPEVSSPKKQVWDEATKSWIRR